MSTAQIDKRSDSTRDDIIEAAGKLFAKNGFAATSIRDISKKARVNLAAVSYHFGDKAGLYRAILECCFSEVAEKFPFPSAIALSDPKAYLRAYILVIMLRIEQQQKSPWQALLMRREMFSPSPSFAAFMRTRIIGPDMQAMDAAFKIIAPEASPLLIKTAITCVIGMLTSYAFPDEFINPPPPKSNKSKASLDRDDLRKVASFIAHTAVAGLHLTALEFPVEKSRKGVE